MLGSDDLTEAMLAFLEKRHPNSPVTRTVPVRRQGRWQLRHQVFAVPSPRGNPGALD